MQTPRYMRGHQIPLRGPHYLLRLHKQQRHSQRDSLLPSSVPIPSPTTSELTILSRHRVHFIIWDQHESEAFTCWQSTHCRSHQQMCKLPQQTPLRGVSSQIYWHVHTKQVTGRYACVGLPASTYATHATFPLPRAPSLHTQGLFTYTEKEDSRERRTQAPTPLHHCAFSLPRGTTPTLLQQGLPWLTMPLAPAAVRDGFATAASITRKHTTARSVSHYLEEPPPLPYYCRDSHCQ